MKGFLFDNDGVLIDSSELHWQSWQLLMEKDKSAPKMSHKQFFKGFGKRNDLILKDIAPDATKEQRDEWAEEKEVLFRDCARGNIQLIQGIEPFLKEVNAAKIPHIIASSTPLANLELFITTTILGKYFDKYVSAEQVAHGKPYPDIFLKAADELGLLPQECIVFEDAPSGIEAAKRAGCRVVAFGTTHSKNELKDYDVFYETPSGLTLKTLFCDLGIRNV